MLNSHSIVVRSACPWFEYLLRYRSQFTTPYSLGADSGETIRRVAHAPYKHMTRAEITPSLKIIRHAYQCRKALVFYLRRGHNWSHSLVFRRCCLLEAFPARAFCCLNFCVIQALVAGISSNKQAPCPLTSTYSPARRLSHYLLTDNVCSCCRGFRRTCFVEYGPSLAGTLALSVAVISV